MSPENNRQFQQLLEYIKQSRGFDFTGYKTTSLKRRIRKRMQDVEIEHFEEYLDYLEVHPDEFIQLFNTILINVTAFFRDPEAWTYLAGEIIPQLLADRSAETHLRVWCPGCSSGEEAYTLAILLAEALGPEAFCQRVKIYATDVDEEALVQARHAHYSARSLEPVPDELRQKYFEPVAGGLYIFRPNLRRSIIFGRHDLVQDSPISRLDLLVCRNTLMYFNAETQARILARFHFALNNSGFLFLGKAEMMLSYANLFTPVSLQHRIFARVPRLDLRDRQLILHDAIPEEISNRLTRHVRLRDVLFDTAPVAQLVVDSNDTLLLANAEARSLCRLGARDLGRPFRDLDISYRPIELRSLIEQALRSRHTAVRHFAEWPVSANDLRYLDVAVVPLLDNGGTPLGVNIAFIDVTTIYRLRTELERNRQDLETAYEELQSTNEELETTNEELQSSNEELETTNEELQSTNEELETMNEELQSTNEELETANDELRHNSEQLNRVNAFLRSILASIQRAVVVVDCDQRITVWNPTAEELWGLRADEVVGQFFLNLDIGLPIDLLRQPIRAVLDGETASQKTELEAVNRRGKTFQCRVICAPLVGAANDIEGVVLIMEERET
jgi:two-component system CheB/CheR fusion protein